MGDGGEAGGGGEEWDQGVLFRVRGERGQSEDVAARDGVDQGLASTVGVYEGRGHVGDE